MSLKKLFQENYAKKIQLGLPKLFHIAELENKRGNKIAMEIGSTRESVIIALLYHVYGIKKVALPKATSHEVDAYVNKFPISIKTITKKSKELQLSKLSGVKLIWTVDWQKVKNFVQNYQPKCGIILVIIRWEAEGGFYYIPLKSQLSVKKTLGDSYFKLAKKGTNPRGIEISQEALTRLLLDKQTFSLPINWYRKQSALQESTQYNRWVELWENL